MVVEVELVVVVAVVVEEEEEEDEEEEEGLFFSQTELTKSKEIFFPLQWYSATWLTVALVDGRALFNASTLLPPSSTSA